MKLSIRDQVLDVLTDHVPAPTAEAIAEELIPVLVEILNPPRERRPRANAAPEHGRSAYSRGCRCDVCVEAVRAYRAERIAAFQAGELDVPHGESSTYVNFRCRCVPCKEANSVARRAYLAARKN